MCYRTPFIGVPNLSITIDQRGQRYYWLAELTVNLSVIKLSKRSQSRAAATRRVAESTPAGEEEINA
jgi:hypothetical protein